jgi:hypothetical protein
MENECHVFGVLILRVRCCKWQNCEATTIQVPCLQFSQLDGHGMFTVHVINALCTLSLPLCALSTLTPAILLTVQLKSIKQA